VVSESLVLLGAGMRYEGAVPQHLSTLMEALSLHQAQKDPDFLRIQIYLTQAVDEEMLANIAINGKSS
jgi:hypothetical protein